jgi:hypothetical protein
MAGTEVCETRRPTRLLYVKTRFLPPGHMPLQIQHVLKSTSFQRIPGE